MKRSLTVLLPVYNAQATLADTVQEILDVVSELTDRPEVVIVDDGSTDATCEVIHELTSYYPQIQAVYHGRRMGREAAIATGIARSSGETLLIREEGCGVAIDAIARLWQTDANGETATEPDATPAGRATQRRTTAHPAHAAGYRMIDRRMMDQLAGASQPTRPVYLSRKRQSAAGT